MVKSRSHYLEYVTFILLSLFQAGKWWVHKENVTCLVVEMDCKVSFQYSTTGNSIKFDFSNCAAFNLLPHTYNNDSFIHNNYISSSADNKTKEIVYQIPTNASLVSVAESNCGEKEDNLAVNWNYNNSFNMKFKSNGSKYDLSEFIIQLNVSSLFSDAEGENFSYLFTITSNAYLSLLF